MTAKSPDAQNFSRPALRKRREDLLLVLPFIIFLFVQLAHHQMWRDETNAWALAANGRSLGSLFHLIRNEAHPYLWYLLLWIASRVVVSVIALKWVAAVLGTCTYLVLAIWSPFSRLEKVLLYCSYYISFEYAVIIRMYGLVLLLLLLYLHSRTSHPRKTIQNAIWLGLIANADTYGVLLTFVLAWEYVSFLRSDPTWWKLHWRKQALPALAVYCVLLATSFAALIPTRHVSRRTTNSGLFVNTSDRTHLTRAIRLAALDTWYPVDTWWPVETDEPIHFWNVSHERHATDAFLAIVLLAAALQFRREKRLLVMLAMYGLILVLFMYLVYMGYSRHYGTMFLAFIAALWIQRSQQKASSPAGSVSQRFGGRLSFGLLPIGVCAWAGAVAAYSSWTHPFSQAGATAEWLRANHYDHAPLVGSPDFSVANVAEYLGRSIYFLDCSCTDSSMQFLDRRDNFSKEQIPNVLAEAATRFHQPFLIFLGVHPLSSEELSFLAEHSVVVAPLAQFTGAEEPDEDFYVYKVTTVSGPVPSS